MIRGDQMGFWSSSLYGNDTTCDVRDSYKKYLEAQMADHEVYQAIMKDFGELLGTDEEPLFWYALADSQWRFGRLTADVRAKAIEWLNQQGGLDMWEDSPSKGAGWQKTMNALREQLMKPMPKRKAVGPPKKYSGDLWELNDVYAYHLIGKDSENTPFYGKYILMQKIASVDTPNEAHQTSTMRLQFFDKVFDQLPTLDDLKNVRILPIDFPYRVNISRDYVRVFANNRSIIHKKDPIWMNAVVVMVHSRAYPKKRLFYIGNCQGPPNFRFSPQQIVWAHFDRLLPNFYHIWQGIRYEEIAPGYYEYSQN